MKKNKKKAQNQLCHGIHTQIHTIHPLIQYADSENKDEEDGYESCLDGGLFFGQVVERLEAL